MHVPDDGEGHDRFYREAAGLEVNVGHSGDDFEWNLVTTRVEARVLPAIVRPSLFARLTIAARGASHRGSIRAGRSALSLRRIRAVREDVRMEIVSEHMHRVLAYIKAALLTHLWVSSGRGGRGGSRRG